MDDNVIGFSTEGLDVATIDTLINYTVIFFCAFQLPVLLAMIYVPRRKTCVTEGELKHQLLSCKCFYEV